MISAAYILVEFVVVMLALMSLTDLFERRIPLSYSYTLFLGLILFLGFHLSWAGLFAFLMYSIMFYLFWSRGLMGGGDVFAFSGVSIAVALIQPWRFDPGCIILGFLFCLFYGLMWSKVSAGRIPGAPVAFLIFVSFVWGGL